MGSAADSVAAANLNGNGRPDLVVANKSSDTLSVLLNTTAVGSTAASFASQQTFATGATPRSVVATDLNGDGRPDLIVANEGDDTVSVLLNATAPGATAPSFAAQQTFAAGTEPRWAAAADMNGDGMPDIVVANQGDGTVSVLLNTTAPGATASSFAAQQTFATGGGPESLTLADVNGDFRPDVIVANLSDATASILLNTTVPGATTLSFAAQQTFATGTNPRWVAAADINGDGLPDLLIADQGDGAVSVLLNTTSHAELTPAGVPSPLFPGPRRQPLAAFP